MGSASLNLDCAIRTEEQAQTVERTISSFAYVDILYFLSSTILPVPKGRLYPVPF